MMYGRTYLILKGEKNGNETSDFTLIMCLPIMQKVSTGILAEQVYGHAEKRESVARLKERLQKREQGNQRSANDK